jgi:hypothetical protein
MSNSITATGAVHRAPRLLFSSLVRRITRHWSPPRVMAIDVARAVAIIGMIGAHVGAYDTFEASEPSTWGALVHGRSSILFAVVAGISLAFVTARARDASPDELRVIRLRLVGRGAAVFIVGVTLESVGAPIVVILTVYGLLFIAVIPFITWSRRRLLIAAGVLAIVCPPVLAMVKPVGGASGPGAMLSLFGTYPLTEWLALMLVGMAIGRSRLDLRRTAATLVIVGAVLAGVGYGVGSLLHSGDASSSASSSSPSSSSPSSSSSEPVPASSLDFTGSLCTRAYSWTTCGPADEVVKARDGEGTWGSLDPATLATSARGALLDASPHSGGTAEIVGSGGVALIVIGIFLLVTRPLRWLLWPLAALGSCTVTAYALHGLFMLVNSEVGGLTGAGLAPGNTYWALLAGGLLVAMSVWSVAFGRGPLERFVGWVADRMAVVVRAPRDGEAQGQPSRAS